MGSSSNVIQTVICECLDGGHICSLYLSRTDRELKGVFFFSTRAGGKRRLPPNERSTSPVWFHIKPSWFWVKLMPNISRKTQLEHPTIRIRIKILGGLERSREVRNFDQKIFQSQKLFCVYRFKNSSSCTCFAAFRIASFFSSPFIPFIFRGYPMLSSTII